MILGVHGHCSLPGTRRDLNCVTTHLSQLQQSLLVTSLPEWVGEPQEVVNVCGSLAMY